MELSALQLQTTAVLRSTLRLIFFAHLLSSNCMAAEQYATHAQVLPEFLRRMRMINTVMCLLLR